MAGCLNAETDPLQFVSFVIELIGKRSRQRLGAGLAKIGGFRPQRLHHLGSALEITLVFFSRLNAPAEINRINSWLHDLRVAGASGITHYGDRLR